MPQSSSTHLEIHLNVPKEDSPPGSAHATLTDDVNYKAPTQPDRFTTHDSAPTQARSRPLTCETRKSVNSRGTTPNRRTIVMKNSKPPRRRTAKKPAFSLEPVNRIGNTFRLRERSKDPNSSVHSRDAHENRTLATGNEVSSR